MAVSSSRPKRSKNERKTGSKSKKKSNAEKRSAFAPFKVTQNGAEEVVSSRAEAIDIGPLTPLNTRKSIITPFKANSEPSITVPLQYLSLSDPMVIDVGPQALGPQTPDRPHAAPEEVTDFTV